MLRMEIALFLVMAFIAYMYFSAEKEQMALHRTFSVLLVSVLIHLALDGATVYTVHHLDTVPELLNDILHRLFLGSMVLVIFLFYQYISILVEDETGDPRRLDLPAGIFLMIALLSNFLLPISYTVTQSGNYSSGLYMLVPYGAVIFYLILCAGLLLVNWRRIERKKKSAIGIALMIEFTVCVLQGLHHTWLISGMGITLMTLSFYLTLENPEALRSELTEQKLSMLYLKSQVNPHFLYNTLDTIRIQAQLNGDKPVADLIMRLVDFFRLSVKVDRPMVTLDDEIELLEALTKIDSLRPDIAIMDINIPIMNGLKVIQMSRLKHPDTAFVIVSGYDDFSYCREALRLQITDYILKSVNYEEFGTCIDNLKISLFQRQSTKKDTPQEERTIHSITRYLQEHLTEEISLSVLAEEFHLNPQYISQLFKSEIGVNFLAYLTNIRMEQAKKLLLTTSLSITEVSERSGYGDYRVFTKVFKKSEGITPSQFRRDFLEKE